MNFLRTKPIPRRTLLKGMNSALALPLLDAMIPIGRDAWAQSADGSHFLAMYFPFGTRPAGGSRDSWTTGANLASLNTLINGQRAGILMNTQHVGGDTHPASTILTANRSGRNISTTVLGESFDQYLVRSLPGARERRIPSLVLGVKTNRNQDLMRKYISWTAPGQFVPKESNPQNVLRRITGQVVDQAQLNRDRSVLDDTMEQAQALRAQLGASDQQRLDQYLESLRALERQVASMSSVSVSYTLPAAAANANLNTFEGFEARSRAMIDMSLIAMQSGQSNVATIVLDEAAGGLSFDGYEYHDSKNDGSMHYSMDNNPGRAYIDRVQQMLARIFAYAAQRSVDLGIWEKSAVLLTSECGRHHNSGNSNMLVSGGLWGSQIIGRNRNVGQHSGRAFIHLAQVMGLNLNQFGNTSGRLTL